MQQLYSTVDLIFVGNVIDKTASAAIGASTLLITCLIGFFGGLAVGAGVVIAQSWGERDTDKLRRAIGNTAALALAGGVVLALLGWLLAPGYLRLIRTPEEIRANAEAYLRIYFLSLPSIVAYNFGAGMLRALGDSKNPLLAQLLGGLVNVASDWLLLRVLANGVVGVAWASLFSQTVAAALVARSLCRLEATYALRLRGIRFDPALLKKTVAIGLPAGAQALVITLSNVVVQAHINAFGADAIAAFTAYFKVELIIYLPIMALGQAIMTFSGQNCGAGQFARIRRGDPLRRIAALRRGAVSPVYQGTLCYCPGTANHRGNVPVLRAVPGSSDPWRQSARSGQNKSAHADRAAQPLPDPLGASVLDRPAHPQHPKRGGRLPGHLGTHSSRHVRILLLRKRTNQ